MSTLTQLFTSIANAIRNKKGTSALIEAEDFPTEIAGITTGEMTQEEYAQAMADCTSILENTTVPSGTISITSNGTHDVTNYVSASVNIPSYPPDWSQIGYSNAPGILLTDFSYAKNIYDSWNESTTSMGSMFENDTNLVYIPLINTSNATNMNSTFKACSKLQYVPLLDTSKVTNMNCLFYQDQLLKEIPLLDTSNVSIFWGMFYLCGGLENVPVLNTSKATMLEKMFQSCPKLSNNSLNNILQMCANATSYTGTKTLQYLGLSSAQATTCTGLSNWTAAQTAGWTTGY